MRRSSSPLAGSPGGAVRFYGDRQDRTEEAKKTFVEIDKCSYSHKRLGDSRSHEFMECDCCEDYRDGENHACDENSDCINRLTLIECVNDLCSVCGNDCRNQRFQRRQYAEISVFETERKGYGVRANRDIEIHEFIYEYIGEVISEDEFRDKMVEYDQRGYQHFYFMMLQTGEFIDATEKGCLARFCNHSCNPNAYVSKWDVAGKLRMGIFANRKIFKGEEITFDYNVDRYGATAQSCYCEEPNCIGFLGGKTQTDAASLLPQNYADALGVNPSMEKKWVKLKKSLGEEVHKGSNSNNINVEFVESLELEPCTKAGDVNKVMSVLLQIDDEYICLKLMQRLLITEDEAMLYQIIKLHGYKCFGKLLNMFDHNMEVQLKILDFLLKLPKTTKNGIISSQIDKKIAALKEESLLEEPASKLLAKWDSFDLYQRIAKKDPNVTSNVSLNSPVADVRRLRLSSGQDNGRIASSNSINGSPKHTDVFISKGPGDNNATSPVHKTTGINGSISGSSGNHHFHHPGSSSTRLPTSSRYSNQSYFERIKKRPPLDSDSFEKRKRQRLEWEQQELQKKKQEEFRQLKEKLEIEKQKKSELEQIIAEANKQKEQQRLERIQREQEDAERKEKRKRYQTINRIEHKWNKFFAAAVPNIIKSYESDLGKIRLKECARDIVKILSVKELKKDPNRLAPLELTKEKRKKIQEFCKIYMDKVVSKAHDGTSGVSNSDDPQFERH